MKPTAEIVEHEGAQLLRIDFNGMGVGLTTPVKPEVLDVALGVLMDKLAGVSKSELTLAAIRALHPEIA